MHVVNTLDEGRHLLRWYGANGAAGALLPAGEVGFAQSLLQRLAANPDEGVVEHMGNRPHPDFLSGPLSKSASQQNLVGPLGNPTSPAERGQAAPSEHKLHLCSPPYAACHAGVNYYRHLVDTLRAEFPHIPFTFTLDCGDDAAIAHDARRLGFTHIHCTRALDPQANAAKPMADQQ